LLVFFVGILALFPTTTKYRASATLKIEPQNPLGTVNEAVNIHYTGNGGYDYYKTQFELLKSNRRAKKVIVERRLSSHPAFLRESSVPVLRRLQSYVTTAVRSLISAIVTIMRPPGQTPLTVPRAGDDASEAESKMQGLVSRYLALLSIDPIRDTRLVRITFTTLDPHLSQELANAHAAAFIRTNIETRFELTKEARDFLEKKLADVKAKLERSENALDAFRREHGVVSLEGNDNVVASRMLDFNRRLVDARDKRIEVESLYRAIKDQNSRNLSKIIDNPRIQQLKAQLDTHEVELARLSLLFKPEHPNIRELNQQVMETRQRLDKEIAAIQRGIAADYAVARSREETLEEETRREQQSALNLKKMGIEYTILDQEAKANGVLYERLLQRINETNVSNTTAVSNIDVAEEALPGSRVASSAGRNLFALAVVGLMLGMGIAFTAEYFSTIIETPEGVWQVAGIPTLGVVPDLRSLPQSSSPASRSARFSIGRRSPVVAKEHNRLPAEELLVFHPRLSAFSESYSVIRTALLFAQEAPPPQVLLVTSAHPDEGKTVTTLNLAISLAQNDYNVLVVDADLRKGNCHTLLQMENEQGLGNVLSDHRSLHACLQQTSVRGLSLLSRGEVPANPVELLSSLQMREGLADLRGTFDFVLIDSPPVVVVSDAAVLATLSDGVVVVINGQKTTVPMVRLLRERLDAVRARLVGVVLNGIDVRNPKYAYYRSYYDAYGAAAAE
ncbi:MAG: GumC family protein, partial [Candidatus Binatia bacterium]